MIRFSKSILSLLFISLILFGCSSGGSSGSSIPTITSADVSDAQALVITDTSRSVRSTTSTAEANLQKLLADGTLQQVFVVDDDGSTDALSVIVEEILVSPDGQTYYFVFEHVVEVDDSMCFLVAFHNNELSCLVAVNDANDIFFGLPNYFSRETSFDNNNKLYFYVGISAGEQYIYSFEPSTGLLIAETSNFEDIGFEFDYFGRLTDGTFIMTGSLEGSDNLIFHYDPISDSLDRLDTTIAEEAGITIPSSLTNAQTGIMEFDDNVYLNLNGTIVKASLDEAGNLSFLHVSSPERSDKFALFDNGIQFYATNDNLFLINNTSDSIGIDEITTDALEPLTLPDIDITDFQISGDFGYYTGTDTDGTDKFIRKSLVDGAETDILNGANLLVQHFTPDADGNVYFGALDLDTTTRYFYKYVAATGELQTLDDLPSDTEITDIVLLE